MQKLGLRFCLTIKKKQPPNYKKWVTAVNVIE